MSMHATIDAKPTTLRERAAQLVFARMGSNMPPGVAAEDDAARVGALLERCPVGGLLIFRGRLPAFVERLAEVQARSPFPLLVAADIERGAGQQLEGATVFPHALAYSALGDRDEELVEASARATAREARACGVHITFAPVADVHLNPRNPIIATRAFSEDPEQAARLVRAYVRGCRAEGLLTTAKHFPGHGRTAGDSHAELPVVESARTELEATDLLPFRAVVEAGVDLVMTAHVAFPALDDEETPATLSRPILHDLLRGEMGFRGAVVTDSLLMGAVRTAPEETGRQAVALLKAGVDILVDPKDPEAVVEGLVQGVEEGRLSEERLQEAFERVWTLKERVLERCGAKAFEPAPSAWAGIDTEVHRALAEEVARRALTVSESRPGALSLAAEAATEGGLLVVCVNPYEGRAAASAALLKQRVQKAFPKAQYRELGPEVTDEQLGEVRAETQAARCVLAMLVVKPAAWQHFGLGARQQEFVEALTRERPVVVAALGSPHVLDSFPEAAAHLCTFSDEAPAQRALIRVLQEGGASVITSR